jgi:uncharacterized SAM-binding protein YcdF (DUF218 family)
MNSKDRFAVTKGMRIVALLLILGGALGVGLTVWLDVNLLMSSQIRILSSAVAIAGVFILLFGWCVWTGVDLWRGRRLALKFAMILFAIQIPVIIVPGFSYQLHTGLMLSIGILAGGQFNAGFQFGSAFNFYISSDVQGFAIGVNLVALFVLIYLIRVWRELAEETRAALTG